MQYIDKAVLVTEIERLYAEHSSKHYIDETGNVLDQLEDFLDTLEVKEVDLDREMQAFALLYLEPLKISDSNIGISITMVQLYSCAKHFFELGLRAQKVE